MNDDSYESELVAELQLLAGVPPGTGSFAIRCRAGTVTVIYKQWNSSPSDLKLEARFDDLVRAAPSSRHPATGRSVVATRPLDIQLRHEDSGDRAAKAEGINVEWQTGDRAFDDAVYVSTQTESAEVLSAVLDAEVRAAVMSLFGLGFRKVSIDDGGLVRAEVTEFVVTRPRKGRGRDAMDAFERLLMNLPVVTASGARHAPIPLARTTRVLRWTAGIFGLVFCALLAAPAFVARSLSPVENPLGFVTLVVGPWIAFALGIPGFLLARKVYRGRVASRMRGSSRAATTAYRAGWAAGLCALLVVATVVQAISLALFVLRY